MKSITTRLSIANLSFRATGFEFKALIIALVFALFSSCAHASAEDQCQAAGRFAATITQFRNLGNDKGSAYAIALESTYGQARVYNSLRMIIDAVYSDYRWEITPAKMQDIIYSACLDGYK